MGRRKVEIKRIQDKSSRQATFSKRRGGLIKKARELSVLCDVQVALVIFSSYGRLYEFSSGDSLMNIIDRYQRHVEGTGTTVDAKAVRVDSVTQDDSSMSGNLCSHKELLEIIQSQLEGLDTEQWSVADLIRLERLLDAALSKAKSRESHLILESLKSMEEWERTLREENENLRREIAELKKEGRNAVNRFDFGTNENLTKHSVNSPERTTLDLLPR